MKIAESVQSEQSILGALMNDNDAIDRIADLKAEHFYRLDHQTIFAEIARQIAQGKRCDVITAYEALNTKVDDCLPYLNGMAQSSASSAGIVRHADIVIEKAIKRELVKAASEIIENVNSQESSSVLMDRLSARIEQLSQKKMQKQPRRLSESLVSYMDVLQARLEGKIKPIQTGFADLDRKFGGGLERGTLTVVAARPAMGKTAFGMAISRNVAAAGTSLFLSMEMDEAQIHDRSVGALGRLPVNWLRNPDENNVVNWNGVTSACGKSQDLNLYMDDQTSLTMLEIRNKARNVKRKSGLDSLVIDQLSFITGSQSDQQWQAIGEYTRGLIGIGKELGVAVVLLCQLNRDCEKRQNKRPMLSDLAMSGSIEQDAANVVFLYRDEVYNPDTIDRGMCEVIIAKQRQGSTGTVPLTYIDEQTRFEDYAGHWNPAPAKQERSRGFA